MVLRPRRPLAGLVILAVAAVVTAAVITRRHGHDLITNPKYSRPVPIRTPADVGLPFQSVHTEGPDGLKLVGWFIPSSNGALIIAQHGYKSHRGELLEEAAMLHRHGFGVLVTSVRAHDRSEGELITFGVAEGGDIAAWAELAPTLPGVDADRIGMLGNSWGGTLAILYAADHPDVRAVVAHSAFSSIDDTVDTSVRFFTGLPAFPFAPLITWWAEREAGFDSSQVDAKPLIGRLSPRPILLLQGGLDTVVAADNGRRLYDAAREPKELWFEPELGHANFDREKPEEYERRVVGFFERALAARK
jgi:fermentation-respiration switch protein FrsA (DUF1100 family)